MRRGVSLAATTAPKVLEASAREAERLGYDSFWVTHPPGADGIAALAPAARVTHSIDVGIGVVPLSERSADDIAAGVRAHALPLDRLLLGLGSGPPRSPERMRDGVAGLRVLGCTLVAGALSERTCRLAGELMDGVLLNWLTPEHARTAAEWVAEGARSAGRERPPVYAYVRLAVGTVARRRLEHEAAAYVHARAYIRHFECLGIARTPEALVASIATTAIAVDDAADVSGRLEDWRDAVDVLVFRVIPGGDDVEAHTLALRAGAQ